MWRQISVQGIEGAKVRRKALAPQAERRPPRHAGNTGGRPRIAEIRGRGGARRPGCPPVRCAAGSRRRRSRRLHELQQPRPEPGRKPSARRSWAKCRDSRSARSATQVRGRGCPATTSGKSERLRGRFEQPGRSTRCARRTRPARSDRTGTGTPAAHDATRLPSRRDLPTTSTSATRVESPKMPDLREFPQNKSSLTHTEMTDCPRREWVLMDTDVLVAGAGPIGLTTAI